VRSCTVDQPFGDMLHVLARLRSVSIFAICMARCLVYRKASTCDSNSSVSNASPFERRSSFVIAESIESRTFCSEVGKQGFFESQGGVGMCEGFQSLFQLLGCLGDLLAPDRKLPSSRPLPRRSCQHQLPVRPTCRGYCSMS